MMLILFGSRDRQMSEYEELFREADPRFRLKQAKALPNGLDIMDFVWEGEDV